MTAGQTIIHLTPDCFGERKRLLVEHDALAAKTFRFENGVCGLKLKNESGHLVMLRTDCPDMALGEEFLQRLRKATQQRLPTGCTLIGPLPSPMQRRAGIWLFRRK